MFKLDLIKIREKQDTKHADDALIFALRKALRKENIPSSRMMFLRALLNDLT